MTDEENRVIRKYFRDGKLHRKDHDRLALKGVRQAAGQESFSDATMTAARYVVPAFQEQDKAEKSALGARSKKIKVIELATENALNADIKLAARDIWNSFTLVDSDHWALKAENDVLYINYYGRDSIAAGKRTEWTLTFESFRTGYFSPIRKKLRASVE